MPCNHPLPAWRGKAPSDTGRLPIVFNRNLADTSLPVEVPCGRCIGCRLEKARGWACRMMHESKLYKHNWFVTFTYDDASLPSTVQGLPTLQPEHFVLFMKRLRKHLDKRGGGGAGALPSPPPARDSAQPGVRFYQCGEYGETTARPHHHAILFNLPLTDLKPMNQTRARNAHTLYTSETLRSLWRHGHISVGAVTFETAAYVASYVTKKILGPNAEAHYKGRVPEYATMSRRPGIGAGFLEKFATDIYPSDQVIIRGHPMRPPKYYDRRLEKEDPDTYYEIRDARLTAPRRTVRNREREAREANLAAKLRKRDAT